VSAVQKANVIVRVISTLLLVCISAYFLHNQIQKSTAVSYLYSDEAASINASRSVAASFVPRTLNGKIYYRSFVAHYLNALGILIVGDNIVGWRTAALAAYFLLLSIPAVLLVWKGRSPLVAVALAVFLGLNMHLQRHSCSARMYMIYMLFATLAACCILFFQVRGNKWTGACYFICCFAAMFSHAHFVTILPGLFVAGLWMNLTEDSTLSSFRKQLSSPAVMAPFLAGTAGIAFSLLYKHLPNVWVNVETNKLFFGAARSFSYPLQIFAETSILRPSLAILALCVYKALRRKPIVTAESSGAAIIFVASYTAVAVSLPGTQTKYVIPLIAFFALLLASLGMEGRKLRLVLPRLVGSMAVIVSLCIVLVAEWRYYSPETLSKSMAMLSRREDEKLLDDFESMRKWIKEHDAIVLSSEPSICTFMLRKLDYHVRSKNIVASTPREEIICSSSGKPIIHSVELLQHVEDQVSPRPIIFFTSAYRMDRKKGTVGAAISDRITGSYTLLHSRQGFCIYSRVNSNFNHTIDENLVKNGNFEGASKAIAMPQSAHFVEEPGSELGRSVMIKNVVPNQTVRLKLPIYRDSEAESAAILKDGQKYVLSCALKLEDVQAGSNPSRVAKVVLQGKGPGGTFWNQLLKLSGTRDWRNYSFVVTCGDDIPADATEACVSVGLFGATGRLWVDNVQLQKVQDPRP